MDDEKSHLLKVFEINGYSRHQGVVAFQKACKGSLIKKSQGEHFSNVLLPFILGTTNKITYVLKKNNVFFFLHPLQTIRSSLRSFRDLVNPKDMKGVYSIPCSCGIPYIGEMGHSINLSIQVHATNIRHNHFFSLVIAEHVDKMKHHVYVEDSRVLARIDHFHHRKLRETIGIEKQAQNLNRDDGWKIEQELNSCSFLMIFFFRIKYFNDKKLIKNYYYLLLLKRLRNFID